MLSTINNTTPINGVFTNVRGVIVIGSQQHSSHASSAHSCSRRRDDAIDRARQYWVGMAMAMWQGLKRPALVALPAMAAKR